MYDFIWLGIVLVILAYFWQREQRMMQQLLEVQACIAKEENIKPAKVPTESDDNTEDEEDACEEDACDENDNILRSMPDSVASSSSSVKQSVALPLETEKLGITQTADSGFDSASNSCETNFSTSTSGEKLYAATEDISTPIKHCREAQVIESEKLDSAIPSNEPSYRLVDHDGSTQRISENGDPVLPPTDEAQINLELQLPEDAELPVFAYELRRRHSLEPLVDLLASNGFHLSGNGTSATCYSCQKELILIREDVTCHDCNRRRCPHLLEVYRKTLFRDTGQQQ